jgi:catechol 2,3-dioxygenase-like lactoylglutathione lyase family enzyme
MQIQNYVHTVADMDKSIAFYRDAMGLAIMAPPFGAAPTDRLSLRENLNVLNNTPGATFRPTYFRVPGHWDWGMELLQFGDIERQPMNLRIDDPAATTFILEVRNLDTMLANLRKGGASVLSPGGIPVKTGRHARSVVLKDLDGMFIELTQPGAIEKDAPSGNILRAKVGITVKDTEESIHFYRDLLGFTAGNPHPAANAMGQLLNLPGSRIVQTELKLPDTSFEIRLQEFKSPSRERHSIRPPMQNPGAPQFTIYFRDVQETVKVLKAEGTPFLGPSTIWDPSGVIILVRAPFPFY